MAGKFTNMRYDGEAYGDEIKRSTNPLMYKLDNNFTTNCKPCFAPQGPRGGHDNSIAIGNQIDVDSILRGINKVNTKSNYRQIPESLDQFNTYTPRDCSSRLEPHSSRYSHPTYDVKGLTVPDMRFGYPLHDPQCQIFEDFGVNTRLQAKDNHRAVWQQPIDQRKSLPRERLGRTKNCTVSVNCTYAPYDA
ncbi:hypothetical protein QLL95_gp1040 [Cotonvirus japonicus]|uniref:Uncharacterized protein n=1 Tax=Cotonvirus japonicus TaxID=2811091 RepID=A0ABM7NSF3_9VIRU|nr:hypothetical protein QLL95_gp1040 [Cotonvirus japonicus]BCS83083.1 hypothetical protein [Cotonvirus japonicus]